MFIKFRTLIISVVTIILSVFWGGCSDSADFINIEGEALGTFVQVKCKTNIPEDEIINIAMADGLSGTYQSACGAKASVDNCDNITVVNSKTLCGPHRYMLEKAVQMRDAGKTAKEIIDWLEYAKEHQESFLIPQDFDFLRRGGRLTPMAATFASVLNLRAIMTQTPDGCRLDKFGMKRSMKLAMKAVVDHLEEVKLDARHIVYVSHARAEEDAKKAVAMIKERLADVQVEMLELGAAFVTQGGPQCVAIQYIEKQSFFKMIGGEKIFTADSHVEEEG